MCPDLQIVIGAWHTLSESARSEILAIARRDAPECDLEGMPGVRGVRKSGDALPDTALQSVTQLGDSKYPGGMDSGRGLSIGGDL